MPMTAAHSHNDYEQRRPLLDALALGYRSVEADIWLRDGELRVSHRGVSFAGTLRELYLDPLQARVDRLGSVLGDGEPFLLWIDLKSGEPELVLELRRLLDRYPMLTRMDGGKMKRGAVTVILTGDENGKLAYSAGAGAHYACRDSNELSLDEKRDPLHLWYALNWTDWFSWDGEGRIPSVERNRLRALVDAVHRQGRKLRLYRLPEAEGVWSEALDAGVDLLSTDELQRLERFLVARPRPRSDARAALR
jgi:glycerophosphoryl diester phosphodiesterase